ncbi:hypothetical protein VDIAB_110649 [Vibrio diabolicus]|nr:hypothetical protein VDIAB_110649 [Vibrio diabolicus]
MIMMFLLGYPQMLCLIMILMRILLSIVDVIDTRIDDQELR